MSGIFDDATVAAVRAFQLANGLADDGDADRLTWVALVLPLGVGDTGEAVTGLQRLLNEKRLAGLALTGIYDAPTGSAVAAFVTAQLSRISTSPNAEANARQPSLPAR